MTDTPESVLVTEVIRRALEGRLGKVSLQLLCTLFAPDADDDNSDEAVLAEPDEEACDCDYHAGRPAPKIETPSVPPGFDDIVLQPRSKSEAKRIDSLRAAESKAGEKKYGRSQRIPGRRYKEMPGGGVQPLCDYPDCEMLARSHGLCRRHGG